MMRSSDDWRRSYLSRVRRVFGQFCTKTTRRREHYFGGPSMEHLRVCVEAVTEFLLTKLGADSVALTR